jgi:hypothetical protein
MKFSKTTFWEFDIAKLDPERSINTIIPRIAMRGTVEEIREMRQYYGDEKIASVLKSVRYLDSHTLSLFSNIYNIPVEDFRCYKEKQLSPQLWNY